MAETRDELIQRGKAELRGTWPERCLQRAFVEGARWWEFAKTGASMWQSDRKLAEIEAVKMYGEPANPPSPQEFYEANATNVCNVPRPGHPEDPSGWAGVRRASEARFVAGDALVMTLADAFDFAEKFRKFVSTKELAENDSE